ncbi:MAG: hypothetical protein Q4G48_06515 [Bacteroidia bacterium]|nr:hypothetical protein [Bacteroidia bacterium]
MNHTARFCFTSILLLGALFSCNRAENEAMALRLAQWDAMVEEHPRAVADSLAQLNPKDLSRANRAYYGLLKTIADDKTFAGFTSDSLINNVHRYYHQHKPNGDDHIRSLVYQGIVRNRMEMADSTVFTPLKEAERLYLKQKQPNPATGNMLYFYLGELLSKNNDYATAGSYFNNAMQLAKQKGNPIHIFDTYLALFWNEMEQENFDNGKLYLDSLNEITNLPPDQQYRLFNSQSIYYEIQNDYEKELNYERAKFALLPLLKEQPKQFRLFYALSEAYLHNNMPDSAMYYSLLAIDHIEDSTYTLNYLLYDNVADIAERQQNLTLALQYRQKAFDVYENSIDNRLDTQIQELEKRYNISEAENKALKAQQNVSIWLGVALIAILLLVLLGVYTRHQRTIAKLKEREAAEKASRLEAEKRIEAEKALRLLAEKEQMMEQAIRQQKIVEVSTRFLAEYAALQEKAKEMTNRVRAKDGRLGDDYERMLKEGQSRFNALAHQQFTETELQKLFGIHQDLEVFSQSDRLFLVMLAANAPNTQIAAMLNTTVHNLKTRKTYLKNKIEKNASPHNNFACLLALFNKNTHHPIG